jgi:hypothetical protein
MNRIKFKQINEELIKSVMDIIDNKGVEYQSNEDVLSNFKTNASDLGLTKYQIWSVYFTKHVKSIVSQIKNNPNNPSNLDSVETTKSRIQDSIAYLLFLNAMLEQDN